MGLLPLENAPLSLLASQRHGPVDHLLPTVVVEASQHPEADEAMEVAHQAMQVVEKKTEVADAAKEAQ